MEGLLMKQTRWVLRREVTVTTAYSMCTHSRVNTDGNKRGTKKMEGDKSS